MKKILSIYKSWLLLFPLAMYFSYRPWIFLGTNETMNYEVSLTLIWLAIFDILGFILLVGKKRILEIRKYWKWLLLPIYFAISMLWSHDRLRATLIIAVLFAIYFAGISIFILRDLLLSEEFKKKFFKSLFISSIVICAWCFIQGILDTAGVSPDVTVICAGCTYGVFGFPHTNGFAVEPQFMGNLLLVPIFTAMYFIIQNKMFKRRTMVITYIVLVATLFFTLSRGAIFAFGLTTVGATIYWFIKTKKIRIFGLWLAILLSFLFTLNLQGILSETSRTDDTYISGVSKAVNQLTLGKIDLGGSQVKKKREEEVVDTEPVKEEEPAEYSDFTRTTAMFDGYIEGSTDERVNSWKSALEIAKDNPKVLFFGVGFGSGPLALYEYGKLPTSKEIINNQYINTLFETGLVGIALAAFTLYLIYRSIKSLPDRMLIYIIMFAYAITIVFFSGLPNALHIYLLPPMLVLFLGDKKGLPEAKK